MDERDSSHDRPRPRAVVADDNDQVRSVVVRVLQSRAGIDVVAACRDGREAVAACHALRPDIALLDLRMPGIDGIGAIALIHAVAPSVTVVILSGSDAEGLRSRALAAGARGYVVKSADVNAMVREISVACSDAGAGPASRDTAMP